MLQHEKVVLQRLSVADGCATAGKILLQQWFVLLEEKVVLQ